MTRNEKLIRNAIENVLIVLKEIKHNFPPETVSLMEAAISQAEQDLKDLV